jgi:uncharacterized membrane protein
VVWTTLTDRQTLLGYFSSFFGILGWLNAAFKGKEYVVLLALLGSLALTSFSVKQFKKQSWFALLLAVSILPMLGLIFFAMLTTWTPHPATIIIGVQGRYFLIPAIVLTYAFYGNPSELGQLRQRISYALLSVLGLYSFVNTTQLLLDRYYVSLP